MEKLMKYWMVLFITSFLFKESNQTKKLSYINFMTYVFILDILSTFILTSLIKKMGILDQMVIDGINIKYLISSIFILQFFFHFGYFYKGYDAYFDYAKKYFNKNTVRCKLFLIGYYILFASLILLR